VISQRWQALFYPILGVQIAQQQVQRDEHYEADEE
jgi:hypothetical protein